MVRSHEEGRAGTAAGLFLVRLGLAAVFIVAGWQKLTGLTGVTGFFDSLGIPAPGVFAVVVAIAEFFGGLGLLVGILARFSGLALAVDMVVAILVATWPQGGWDGSRLEVVLLLGGLAIALAGPGLWTLPHVLDRPELDVETTLLRRWRGS